MVQIPIEAKKHHTRRGVWCSNAAFNKEMEGFDFFMVLPPSSWRQATVHRTVALNLVQIPIEVKKHHTRRGCGAFWRRWRDLNPRTPCGA